MKKFICKIVAFSIVMATLGCKQNEAKNADANREETRDIALPVLSVGMSVADANEVLKRVGLTAIEEDSGSAMVGAAESKKLRAGVNTEGDALYFLATVSEDGTETVTDLFWHRNWLAESNLPKSERNDVLTDVGEVNLNDNKLTASESAKRIEKVDTDPFGG
jgi:hypothetical protein